MGFRDFLAKLEVRNLITNIDLPVYKKLEAAGIMHKLDGQVVKFNKIRESGFAVAGNVFSKKELVAAYFGCKPEELTKKMMGAIESPSKPEAVKKGVCQEVEMDTVDLDKLPILFHADLDGGNYVSSGVFVARDKEHGQNVSFHRCMQIGKNRFSMRILERHLNEFIKRNGGELDVALCVGCGANVLLAGATSVELGKEELGVANTLAPLEVVKAKSVDVEVPADAEFVIEGRILREQAKEGPFVDLTGTYDVVREQPVFEVKKITHRKDAVWHALLPGGLEHKVLMGMPREPTIFKEVSRVCNCLDVSINPGGCSWLHAIVKIDKQNEGDAKKALEAAFAGHKSLKHAFVVDGDIDILNPLDVEWAMATRFQGDRGLIIKPHGKGSSLDPSADPISRETCKVGFDLTMPLGKDAKAFERAEFYKVDVKKYLGEKK